MGATAIHVDEAAGIREEAGFFGAAGARLHGCLHAPLHRVPAGGLVLCCSILAELQESYRLEVLLARTLARRGIAVQRFHYRGSGHSDGSSGDITFDTMRADALTAAEWLAEQTEATRPAFMGLRLGGLVAASAGRAIAGAALVLWAPTFTAERYFRDAIRARMIHQMRRGGGDPGSAEAPGGAGVLDVFGYPIHPPLRESAAGRTLPGELGERPGPVRLVQLDGKGEPDPAYVELAGQLREHGVSVDLQVVPEQPAWWFSGGTNAALARLGDGTADWLLPRLARARA
jgi:alpha-beta hydrolase superfamily lysophospholipase